MAFLPLLWSEDSSENGLSPNVYYSRRKYYVNTGSGRSNACMIVVGRVRKCLAQGGQQFEHFTEMSCGVLECDIVVS